MTPVNLYSDIDNFKTEYAGENWHAKISRVILIVKFIIAPENLIDPVSSDPLRPDMTEFVYASFTLYKSL